MPTIINFLSKILEPVRVFIAIILVSAVWLAPVINSELNGQTNKTLAVYAGENNQLSCSYGCQIDVCTRWVVPSLTCQPSNPWDIGCCTRWERQCDSDCDDMPPNLPPIISHSLTCTNNGNDSWCKGNLSLDVTASDPQNAQIIISGDVNGITFICPTENPCPGPLPEGQGNINYRVDSSTTLSATGSTVYKKDAITPQVNGSITGSSGSNNWYITSTTLSATSSDVTSGIASFEMNVDDTGWVTYEEVTFTDGIYTIQYRAVDTAGNITETTQQEIKVDTVTPTINTSITGTNGSNNWYTSSVSINSIATDSNPSTSSGQASGISAFEMNIDNTGWEAYSDRTLMDGVHTIQYRATDYAGNTFETSQQTIRIDATTPSLNLSTNGTTGQNNWFVSAASITPTATDITSGILKIETSINNGIYNEYITPLQFTDGIHTYQIKVTDNAGNITQTPLQTIKIDTIAPAIDTTAELDLGDSLYYSLQDDGSGLWINRTVIEDEDERYQKIVWLEEISGNKVKGDILWDGKFKDGVTAPLGEYFITLKISDYAGNETFQTATVKVNLLSFLQLIPPFTPPITHTEPTSNEQNSQLHEEQTFGGDNNGNTGNETSTISNGGENVLQGLTAQTSAFIAGNESTTTSIPTSNVLWGAMATALLGYTVAEWQRQKEEAEAEMWRLKNQARKEKEAEYLSAMQAQAYQQSEQAIEDQWIKEQREKTAQTMSQVIHAQTVKREKEKEQASFDHRMSEHENYDVGGSKVLAVPVQQEPNPPESSWWDLLNPFWYFSDEPWPWENGSTIAPNPIATQTAAIQTAWAQITQTAQAVIPTITPTSTPTSTPTPVIPNYQIYKPDAPLTAWELTVGGQVAHNAHLLLAQANNFYFWSNNDPGTNSYPPKPLNYNRHYRK